MKSIEELKHDGAGYIQLGKKLRLPARTALVQKYAFVARSGAGKTHAAGVLVEGMIKVGGQVIVIDPVGVWWGLRLAADGKRPGIMIPVFGGLHADVPIYEDNGRLVAEYIVQRGISAVIDVSMMRKAQRIRFLAEFLETLFEEKKKKKSPVHLVIEEAATVAPQSVKHMTPELGKMMGAAEDVIRRGRNFGIGVTLIDQRPQSVDKDVLNQVEVLVALQTNGTQERKAIKEWADSKRTHGAVDFLKELPDLAIGEAWIWSPQWLKLLERDTIAPKWTFDASATPELGDEANDPGNTPQLTAADLEALRAAMNTAIQREEGESPALLRKRIATLEKRILELEHAPQSNVALGEDGLRMIGTMFASMDGAREAVSAHMDNAKLAAIEFLRVVDPPVALASKYLPRAVLLDVEGARGLPRAKRSKTPEPSAPQKVVPLPVKRPAAISSAGVNNAPEANEEATRALGGGELRMMIALDQAGGTLSRTGWALLSGYAPGGGTFARYVSTLKTEGWVTINGAQVTLARRANRIITANLVISTRDVVNSHMAELGGGERAIFRVLLKLHPESVDRSALAGHAGYGAKGGTFARYISTLSSRELIVKNGTEISLAPELFKFGEFTDQDMTDLENQVGGR